MGKKIVDSKVFSLKSLFSDKYDVDFYQREYVWESRQVEDLINDLSHEFLRHWREEDDTSKVRDYDPYFMGEVVLSKKEEGRFAIIDGQQRFTTFSLLLIFLKNKYPEISGLINTLIYSDDYGTMRFTLNIRDRKECMESLYETGRYEVKESDDISVQNLIARYNDMEDNWLDEINQDNIKHFTYWLIGSVVFSKVWTDDDSFAYLIFETMNDRGLSLTSVEMLRSYLLANVNSELREKSIENLDNAISMLQSIKLSSKSKADLDFFKTYLRGHYAETFNQKDKNSDFTRIGNQFHRWVKDKSTQLKLSDSQNFIDFIDKIAYFSDVYKKVNDIISNRDTTDYLYVIVNADYNFTLQTAVILAGVSYLDSKEIIEKKIKIISKYLTKVLSWKVWQQSQTSQSAMEAPIYELAQKVRGGTVEQIEQILKKNPINIPSIDSHIPVLNQQNKNKLRVLLALITEIVARESSQSNYLLNQRDKKNPIEVEHIWPIHFEEFQNEFEDEATFANTRNRIGGLLLLPKKFNASYNDKPYSMKIEQYFSQNVLAKSLNFKEYTNDTGFKNFIMQSGLCFKAYENFTIKSNLERSELYREILKWNWRDK